MTRPSMRHAWALAAILLFGLPYSPLLPLEQPTKSGTRFFDAPSQSAEFIGYARSLRLTPAQQQLRDRVLERIPAPCCAKFPARTCCCPCNLAKSIWGLSNFVIARENADAAALEKAVRGWIRFVNPGGFTGNACDTAGGCARKFSANGCGGMDERNLHAAR
ncbi:MAG: hypothetical protein ACRD3M_06390 [Thermoanaerobaculia bacterium]